MLMKTFEGLKDVRDKFRDDEEAQEDAANKEANSAIRNLVTNTKYGDHANLRKRDLIVQELLQLVLMHVNQLNSPRTALKLLGRASGAAQNRQTRSKDNPIQSNIITAGQALKNYLKVGRKKKTKFGKYNPTHAKTHWLQKFNDAIQDALVEVQIDIQKREGSFFDNLIRSAKVELPLKLPESKKVIYATAPVVVNLKTTAAKISAKTKFNIIEGRLVLLTEAKIIGLNTTKTKATKGLVATANQYAEKKYGATVYPTAIARPSKNILWFLVLDFDVNIDSAVFSENLAVTSDVDGIFDPREAATLADYVNRFNALKEQRQRLNRETQRSARIDFEKDFVNVYDDIKIERRKLEALVEGQHILANEFALLTSIDHEAESGLAIKQYDTKSFYDFFDNFVKLQQSESLNRNKGRLEALWQRVEARYVYFCYQELARAATRSRAILKGMTARLEEAKKMRRTAT